MSRVLFCPHLIAGNRWSLGGEHMSTRRTTVFSLRSLGWLGVIALLVLPFTLLIGAPTRTGNNGKSDDSGTVDLGAPGSRVGQTGLNEAELKFIQKERGRNQQYARPDLSGWWAD